MRKLCVAVLVLTAVSVMVLIAVPASSAADDKVTILYERNSDIIVEVPSEIPKGSDLMIRAYSAKYDLERSGIMLYTLDSRGVPDHSTSGRPPISHSFGVDGYVTFYFSDITENVELSFTELAKAEKRPVNPGTSDKVSEIGLAGVVAFIAIIMGAAMLIIMISINKMLAPPPDNSDGTA